MLRVIQLHRDEHAQIRQTAWRVMAHKCFLLLRKTRVDGDPEPQGVASPAPPAISAPSPAEDGLRIVCLISDLMWP